MSATLLGTLLQPGAVAGLLMAPAPPAPSPAERPGPAETEEVGVVAAEDEEKDPTVFPDPKKFSTGFFAEGAMGAIIPVGPTSDVLGAGYALSLRSGYEFRRWFAIGVHVTGSISPYDDGLITDELFLQYFYTGELRFGIPIRRFLIAFYGGAGGYTVSSNLMQVADIANTNRIIGFAYDAGLALDFHSLSKHFSGGVMVSWIGVPDFEAGGSILAQLYLRYTL